MRLIIRIIKLKTTDEEAVEMKKKIVEALKDHPDVQVTMTTD